MMKLSTQHSAFPVGAWEELAGQPYGRTVAYVFYGWKLVVIGFSFRPMAAIDSTQVVGRYVRETASSFHSTLTGRPDWLIVVRNSCGFR